MMNNQQSPAQISLNGNTLVITGVLSLETILVTLQAAEELIRSAEGNSLVVDLAQVIRSDSTGLSLLINLKRAAAKKAMQVQFLNLPRYMQDVARVSGVDGLLGL